MYVYVSDVIKTEQEPPAAGHPIRIRNYYY